jgi:hypothetical protein
VEFGQILAGLTSEQLLKLRTEIDKKLREQDGNPIRVRSIPQGVTFEAMKVVRAVAGLDLKRAYDLLHGTPFDLHLTGSNYGRPLRRHEILAELQGLGVDCE